MNSMIYQQLIHMLCLKKKSKASGNIRQSKLLDYQHPYQKGLTTLFGKSYAKKEQHLQIWNFLQLMTTIMTVRPTIPK